MRRGRKRRAAEHADFESFYKAVRGRLLLQTYALTGDLPAAQKAVRDALIVAWHHWRKVSRLDDPEDWVRPLAWSRALRRSTARLWGRAKDVSPEAKETLDALGKLSTIQRKVLLLTHLTTLPLDRMAPEAGVPRPTLERELQLATSQFAVHRNAASTSVRRLLESLEQEVADVRWPRPSILTRAGSARRRSHTTLGAAAAVAALVVSGSLVTDAAGVRPELVTKGILEGQKPTRAPQEAPPPDPLTVDALVTTQQLTDAFPGRWHEGKTSRNTDGDGLVFTCQAGRYADPGGVGALVRTFTAEVKKGTVTAGQSAEASVDEEAGERTYETTLGWYAGCTTSRVQLIATYDVPGIGDDARLFLLRSWDEPVATQVVGVARTGALTTTTMHTQTTAENPLMRPSTRLLAAAVDSLCGLPDGGACASRARARASAPLPVGAEPSMLSEVDLPPVTKVAGPWVGTDPGRATDNVAATRCDDADFATEDFSRSMTRSFLIPTAPALPAEFGLTQTVGALPRSRAEGFVAEIRKRLTACPDEDLGTEVSRLAAESSGDRELMVWRLTVEISDERSVRFLMAIIRNGTGVSQLTFVPSGEVMMDPEAFIRLAKRAQARLAELGPPAR